MRSGRGHLALVAVGLILALVIGACGSDGGTETSAVRTIPKAEFMKKVTAICAQANNEIGRVYNQYAQPPYPGGKPPTSEDMNKVAEEVVIPARAKQVRRIRALGAPPGEERKVDEILEAIEEGIEEGERDRRTLRGADAEYGFTRALNLQIDYGLEECATG
jgi:hypothetical protein